MNMSFLFNLILYIPVNNVSGMSGPRARGLVTWR